MSLNLVSQPRLCSLRVQMASVSQIFWIKSILSISFPVSLKGNNSRTFFTVFKNASYHKWVTICQVILQLKIRCLCLWKDSPGFSDGAPRNERKRAQVVLQKERNSAVTWQKESLKCGWMKIFTNQHTKKWYSLTLCGVVTGNPQIWDIDQ